MASVILATFQVLSSLLPPKYNQYEVVSMQSCTCLLIIISSLET